jgi:hypothetical protein
MWSKIRQTDFNKIHHIYDNLPLFEYHLPDFKSVDMKLYIDLDSIQENVKKLLIHESLYVEVFFYNPDM